MKQLNALSQIDYEKVNDFKMNYLHQIFEQEGKKMMKYGRVQGFLPGNMNSGWFLTHSIHTCAIRMVLLISTQWPDHNVWDEAERKALDQP